MRDTEEMRANDTCHRPNQLKQKKAVSSHWLFLIAVVKIQEKQRGTNLDPLDTVHRQLYLDG